MILHSKQLIRWSTGFFPWENPTLVFHCKAADQTRAGRGSGSCVCFLALLSKSVPLSQPCKNTNTHTHPHRDKQTDITQSRSVTDPTAQLASLRELRPLIAATVHAVDEERMPVDQLLIGLIPLKVHSWFCSSITCPYNLKFYSRLLVGELKCLHKISRALLTITQP